MKPLYIAFVWNQHQPFYQDTAQKKYIMPWVRLHAAKDYYQMAAILRRYPKIRQTFYLTPLCGATGRHSGAKIITLKS